MKIKDITNSLETWAPLMYQEDYDNAGLLVGNSNWACTGIIVSLDTTIETIQCAIKNKYNLIISHHPIIFKGLKKINGKNEIEKCIIEAIKNDIAIYAIHTNLDNVITGVNYEIANKIKLQNCKILNPTKNNVLKLRVYVPISHKQVLLDALFKAGAGKIGLYNECSFTFEGIGTYQAQQGSTPYLGEIGKTHTEPESCIEVVLDKAVEKNVMEALHLHHPYQTIAFDLINIENKHAEIGAGLIGNLKDELNETDFLNHLCTQFQLKIIKHTKFLHKKIKKVAICGGAGSFLISKAIQAGADCYISADFKYHDFFEANNQLIIMDIGHWESEQFTSNIIIDFLKKKFPTFASLLRMEETNPINYYIKK